MSWLSDLFGGGSDDQTLINAAWAQYFQQQEQQRQQEEARKAQEAAQQQQQQAQEEQQRQFDAQIALLQQQMQPSPLEQAQSDQQITDLQTQQQRDALRQQALGTVNQAFAPEFEQTALPSTFDDPYVQQAYSTERGKIDEYLNNLLKRNVITQQGYQSGEKQAEEQAGGVRSQLQDVANSIINAQRGTYTDIANRARNTASTLDIGQNFDITPYTSELTTAEQDFANQFGDKYSGQAPKNLFDPKAVLTAAGTGQGAQNLAFDPLATGSYGAGGTTDQLPIPPRRRMQTAVF